MEYLYIYNKCVHMCVCVCVFARLDMHPQSHALKIYLSQPQMTSFHVGSHLTK